MPGDVMAMQHRMKKLFTEGFTVLDIADALPLIDCSRPSLEALDIIEETRRPLVGVLRGGSTEGFVRMDDARGGADCEEVMRPFDDVPTVEGTASFPATFESLTDSPYCFVRVEGEIRALVCRMDIQKPPVRMWLFGMVTIIEMFMTRIILDAYPGDGWKDLLSKNRLKRAERLMTERARRGVGVRVIDCLQLSDKANIVIKDPELFKHFRFDSKRSAQRAVKEFEALRNNLAHSHDLSLNWDAILDISKTIDINVARL